MVEEHGVAAHVAALTRVHEELVAEIETTHGPARYAELQPLLADVEWALSQCRTRASTPHTPQQP